LWLNGGSMRIGLLNLAARQLFIMDGVHSASTAKEFIETHQTGMEGGMDLLKIENLHTFRQNS